MAIYQAVNGLWYDGATSQQVPAPTGATGQTPVAPTTQNSSPTQTSAVTTVPGLPAGGSLTDNYGRSIAGNYFINGQWLPIPSGVSTANPTTTGGTLPNSSTQDQTLAQLLSGSNLSADQKQIIQTIYDTVSVNDTQNATKLASAITAGMQFSDPYFKAQGTIALDALTRGISGKDGDLAFAETQLQNALKALQDNTAASKDQLSFQHAQELKDLAQKYSTDLSNTQDNLAAAGLGSSSKRARAEQILSDTNTGLVESSNRQFGYQTGNLDRALATSDVSTQAQIENLRRLTDAGKLDLFRTAETQVGSNGLPTISGLTPLGGIQGDIPQAQAKDALSFASQFVF